MEIKVLLFGYQKSKRISSFSSYLISKYYKVGPDVVFLNYGKSPLLFGRHSYEKLRRKSLNTSRAWSYHLRSAISKLVTGEVFVLGLDDYFLSKPVNQVPYRNLLSHITANRDCVGAKLGLWTSFNRGTTEPIENGLYRVTRDSAWPVNTQLTIWRKEFILDYLKDVDTPWEFELKGSNYYGGQLSQYIIGSYDPALSYPEPSALSKRHPNRVSVFANQDQDIEFGIERGFFKETSLILGQWNGHAPSFERGKESHWLALSYCSAKEYEYHYNILKQCMGPWEKAIRE